MDTSILDTLDLNEQEKLFIKESKTATTTDMNQSRIISEIYFAKKLEKVADRVIISNEKLAKSNEKYVKGMLWLTGAIVFVGIVQIVIAIFGK